MSDTFYTLRTSAYHPLCYSRKYDVLVAEAERLSERDGLTLNWHHFGDGSSTAMSRNRAQFYITPMKFLEDQ